MGFSFITGQEIVAHADNASFDGTERAGRLLLDGQLWIGSTALPHVVKATLTAGTGISITNASGSITIATNGAVVGQTITGDTGGPLSPSAGNWNILGQQASTIAVMDTIGSGNTLKIEDRTWQSQFIVDASSTVGLRGTFTTIQAAINAAVSGQSIGIRPGNYVENLTMKAGVNLYAMTGEGYAHTVIISGSIACTYNGRASISGCQLISGTSDGITVSGVTGTILTVKDCVLSQAAGAGTHYSVVCSAVSGEIYIWDCFGSTDTNGSWFNVSNGNVVVEGTNLPNTGGSSLNNLVSGGNLLINNSIIGTDSTIGTGFAVSAGTFRSVSSNLSGVVTSSGTGVVSIENTRIFTPGSTALTVGGSGAHEVYGSELISDSASAVSVSSGKAATLSNVTINSTNTNAITGAGTVNYGGLIFTGSSSLMNTTTQVPLVKSNDAIKIKTPGAYPYTTVPQDELILVDTSSARTITPLASPTTGQKHVIKDNVGSANSNNITVTPSGANIDGAASSTINIAYGSITIVFNGTQWNII